VGAWFAALYFCVCPFLPFGTLVVFACVGAAIPELSAEAQAFADRIRDFLSAYREASLSPSQQQQFMDALTQLQERKIAEGNKWEVVAGDVM
jgi:hypothetical protein